MRLITEPDFITRSKEPVFMSDETRADASIKLKYLKSYYDGLRGFMETFNVGRPYEKIEHGVKPLKHIRSEYRAFNSVRYTKMVEEISLIGDEIRYLETVLNA